MQPHRRPDADITPEQFFSTWLPAELERLGGTANIGEVLVRIELEGDGGGAWDLKTAGGKLEVGPRRDQATPLVVLTMTVPDWRAIVVGEEGPVDLTPPSASPTDLLFVDTSSQQLLATIKGTFRFEVNDYNGRTWKLSATFGGTPTDEEPKAIISTDAETYAAILAREMAAPEAYFKQKVVIAGDMGMGMQVSLALLPKL